MTLSTFTPEQMIQFCFTPSHELEAQIIKLQKDFYEYFVKVKDGQEPFSESKHNELLSKITILTKCNDAQIKFLDAFISNSKYALLK